MIIQKKNKSPTDILNLKKYLRSIEFMNKLLNTISPKHSEALILQLKYQNIDEYQTILNYGTYIMSLTTIEQY